MLVPKLRRSMKIVLIIAVGLFAISIYLGYGTYMVRQRAPQKGARSAVAATVNGRVIPMYVVDDLFRQYMSRIDPKVIRKLSNEDLMRLKRSVLERIIRYELLYQEAVKERLLVGKDEIDKQLKNVEKQFKTKEEFLGFLKRNHITIDNLKEEISRQMMVNKLLKKIGSGVKISDEDAKKFYDRNLKLFTRPEMVKLRIVVLKDREAALKVKKNLQEGAKWKDATKGMEKAVLLNTRDKVMEYASYNLPKEVSKEAFKAETGSILGPIEVKGKGDKAFYYIVKVEGRVPSKVTPFKDAKDKIKEFLRSQRVLDAQTKFVDNLQKQAKIEIVAEELKPKSGKKKTVKPATESKKKETTKSKQ